MKKNQNFKQTEIGRIPKEWEVVKLGDEEVAGLIMGQSPPSSTYNNTGIGLPFFQGNAEFGEMYPTPVLSCSHPIKITEENDILLSVRAPVGDVNIAPFKSCIGRGLAAIRPKGDKFDYLFLFYYLKLESRLFESLSMGSTFKAIRKIEIEKFRVLLPPLPEQKKIAEILSTVDQAIEKVDEAIAKTKRLKKGLMRKLMTKGIGHKEFRDTEIGRMPKEWEAVKTNQISEVRRGASPRPIGDPKYFSNKGRGWIRISDVTNTYKYLRRTSQYLSRFGESKSVEVNPGDLIMSICATIGKPIIIDMKACIHDGFVVFRNLSNEIDTEFLFYALQRNELKFVNMKQTGTQGNLNTTLVGKTFIPLPPLPEQKKIAEILSTVDKRLELLRGKKGKLGRIKKGLMNDLLTGKRKVRLET